MNEITIGDKLYISSKRAAEITGYAKDYVGQLCREGHVDAKMVGRSWYVYEPSIRAHRFGVEAESLEEKGAEGEEAVESEDTAKEQQIAAPSDDASTQESDSTWQKPTYSSELPQELPELQAPAYVEPAAPTEQTLTDMQAAWREWFERKQEIVETPEVESPEGEESPYEASGDADEDADDLDEEVKEEEMEGEDQDEGVHEGDGEDEDEEVEEYEEETQVPLHRIEEEPTYAPAQESVRPVSLGMHDVVQAAAPVGGIRPTKYAAPAPETQEGRVIEERIMPKQASAAKRLKTQRARGKNSHLPVIALLIAISLVSIAIAAIGSGMATKYFQTTILDNPIFDFLVGDREFKR